MSSKTDVAASSPIDASDIAVPAWWLAGIVGVALSLRLVGLNSGLWIDEIFSLVNSFRGSLWQIVTVFPGDNQHPFYSVLAHVSLSVFGESAWAIRLPAALLGAATVPALYWLGSMVVSRREALFAAVLLSVSYHHIWFSQNARGYSALALLAVLSTACLIRGLRGGPKSSFAWYAVAAALGCYVHLTMVFMVIAQALVWSASWLLTGGPRRQTATTLPLLGFAGAGVLTLVLYAPVFLQVSQFFVDKPSVMEGVSTPGWALQEGLRVLATGIGGGSPVAGALLILLGAVLGGLGVVSLARKDLLACALFISPALVTILGALVARGTMYPRFFFSLIGFAVLIGVRGIMVASGGRNRWAISLVGLAVVASAASLPFNYRYPKQDFDGARQWIESRTESHEQVASVGGATTEAFRRYLNVPWREIDSLGGLNDLRGNGPVWVVYTFPRYIEPALREQLQMECEAQAVFPGTVGGGDIVVRRCQPIGGVAGASARRVFSWRS